MQILALSVCLVSLACSARFNRKQGARSDGLHTSGMSVEALAKWDAYIKRTTEFYKHNGRPGWQKQCEPKAYPNQGDYKGTAILFHGYTACPQQYLDLAPMLAQRGFTVLVPLIVGHGYNGKTKSSGKFVDYLGDMPKSKNDYIDFANEMHAIMQSTDGERVVFGLSHGGSMATWLGNLGGYARRLIAAPFIRAEGIVDQAISLANRIPWRKHQVHSWGESCEAERAAGREGYCQFSGSTSVACRDFGQSASNKALNKIPDGDIQILFVDGDEAVSDNAVFSLARKFGFDPSSKHICGLPNSIPHSFMAKMDNLGDNVWWMDEMNQKVVDYLVDGVVFAQGSAKYSSENWPGCQLTCTPESCHKIAEP